MNPKASILFALTGLLASINVGIAAPFVTGSHQQLVRTFYTESEGLPAKEITAVTVTRDGTVLVAARGEVARLDSVRWLKEPALAGVGALFAPRIGPSALAGATNGVWLLQDGKWQRDEGSPANVIAFADEPDGIAWALAPDGVWRRDNGWTLINKVEDDAMFHPYSLLPRSSNEVVIAAETGLFGLAGKRLYWLPFEVHAEGLPSPHTRAIARLDADHFFVTTDKGLTFSDGARGWQSFTGAQGLPILDLRQISIGPDRVVWLGSDQGLVEWNAGKWSYLESKRWLPDNKITALAAGPDESVWAGTSKGLVHIYHRKLSFTEKADILQRDLESRDRRFGYVTEIQLRSPGVLAGALQEISDNDGDWTSLYIAAQSFRYAVTKAPEAKAQAWRSMQALLRLESITGISGFPSRAICSTNEEQFATRAIGSDPEWHRSPVEPDFYWKGETSSDEVDGHYLGWYVYYELVADEAQKSLIRATCKRVTDHILDHGFSLIDKDGKPTTWAVWSPARLNDDPRYWEERGVNALEILSHLKVAMHIVKEPRYEQAYRDLIRSHHFALNTLNAKIPGGVVFDNELMFMAYYPLLQLEKDPALRAMYIASLRRTWSFVRREGCPVWNFIYGASTGEPCDVEAAVETLREIPLDFIHWKMSNSHRADIDPANRKPLPWINRVIHHWDSDPLDLDGGGDMGEGDQTVWLMPYWMGRYYGFID